VSGGGGCQRGCQGGKGGCVKTSGRGERVPAGAADLGASVVGSRFRAARGPRSLRLTAAAARGLRLHALGAPLAALAPVQVPQRAAQLGVWRAVGLRGGFGLVWVRMCGYNRGGRASGATHTAAPSPPRPPGSAAARTLLRRQRPLVVGRAPDGVIARAGRSAAGGCRGRRGARAGTRASEAAAGGAVAPRGAARCAPRRGPRTGQPARRPRALFKRMRRAFLTRVARQQRERRCHQQQRGTPRHCCGRGVNGVSRRRKA
jgi:hypothetical protein